ncbi:GntR family transcriptional regulator [Actinomadura rubrobrunea]|uniref:GntR family transcriptional regulator n=1 Tax=Actinomadura rubrobrunea TaxID=115335 RepID=A0A9W6PW29_9ACTN|nr:GntR family transcriptional regulator [Actinomadura rubrobrunea]GLW64063.1 GntR family transcriptional regulator [Actinomadura rubrobrunea]
MPVRDQAQGRAQDRAQDQAEDRTKERWIAHIEAARADLARSSTAARVAGMLREQIIDGLLRPGERLSEQQLHQLTNVSRNTLREAFRMLVEERLLVHEFNRGVFVRHVTPEDVVDLYRVRRILECEGVRAAPTAPPEALARLEAAVSRGERAAEQGRWSEVGAADIRFHEAVGGLVGSPRVNEMLYRTLTELRLSFHEMVSAREFHEPYLRRNRLLTELILGGDVRAAERELRAYLDDAEAQLLEAYRAAGPARKG